MEIFFSKLCYVFINCLTRLASLLNLMIKDYSSYTNHASHMQEMMSHTSRKTEDLSGCTTAMQKINIQTKSLNKFVIRRLSSLMAK